MVKKRLQYRDGIQDRSCEIAVEGSGVSVLEDGNTETHRYDSAAEAEAAAAELIDERRQAGWVIRFEPDPEISRYYREDFVAEVVGDTGERDVPGEQLARLEELHNTRFPDELRAFFEMRDRYPLGYAGLAEWRIWGDDEWLPDPDAGNLFEQVVLLDQRNYLGTAMLEYGAAMVYLGSAGNGDCYFAALDHRHPENTPVAFWDHETQDLTHICADSIATLAYANHLLEQTHSGGDLDSESLAAAAARLEDRCALSWHYRSLCEAADIEPELESDAPTRFYFYRALPLSFLLNNNHKLHVVENLWGIIPHEKLDFEATVNGPFLATVPATAYYWLWRLFFFDKDDELRRAIAACADSPSPMIRDMAALVEQLQDGRKELGSIDDIHELRRRFIELDLDPERAAQRAREEAEAARQAELQAETDRERVAEWTATRTTDDLVELAWKHVGNEVIVDGIYEHLAGDAALAPSLVRWRFLADQGASRDNCYFSHENDETIAALAASAPAAMIPLLLTHGSVVVAARIAARTGEVRDPVRAAIREHLDAVDEYCHRNTRGVRAAVAVGAADYVDDFLAMLDRFAYDPEDSIAGIEKKDVNVELIRALGRSGDARATERLLAIAAGDNPKLVAPALSALGELGDRSATPALIARIGGEHSNLALYALARLGDPAARPAIAAYLERLAGLPELLVYPRLMATALADTADPEIVSLALEVIQHNPYEQVEQFTTAIRLSSDVDALRRFVDAEHEEVRQAALSRLAALGQAVEPRRFDRGTVDALFAAGGIDALREALSDPAAVYRHNLVRKAVDEGLGAEIADAAFAYARDVGRFEHYTYQYVHSDGKWNQLTYGLEAAAQCSPELAHWLLTHPNVMVREVFRYGADAIKDAAARVGPMELRAIERPAPRRPVTATAEALGDPSFTVGAMINGAAYTPDGAHLVVVGAGGGRILDAATGALVRTLDALGGGWTYDVDVHPGGELAAAGNHSARLILFNLADGTPVATLHEHGGSVRKVRFSPGGDRLVTAGEDQHLIFWRRTDGGEWEAASAISEPFDVNGVDWLDDDTAVFATDKHVGIARFGADEVERRVDMASADVRVFAGGTRIAAGGSSERSIAIFDRELDEIARHRQANVARVRFDAGESHMIAASWSGDDTGVWRWDLSTGERTLLGHDGADAFALAVCPKTGVIAAGGKLNRIVRFAADGASLESDAAGHASSVDAIAADAERIYTASSSEVLGWPRDGGVAVTCADAGADAIAVDGDQIYIAGDGGHRVGGWSIELERSEVVGLAGHCVAFGSGGDLVWVDREGGAEVHRETISDDTWVEHLVDLGGGRAVVAGYREHHFEIWDLVERTRLHRVELPASADRPDTCHYTYSAATGCVYVSRWDRAIVEIDAATGDVRRTIQLDCPHYPIAASPVAPLLCLARGNQVLFLDLEDCAVAGEVQVGGAGIESMAFVGDRQLCCGASGGEVTVVTVDV